MAIADVLEQTAPDFANPPAPQRVFEKIRQRPQGLALVDELDAGGFPRAWQMASIIRLFSA
jgi:hypothetical protein